MFLYFFLDEYKLSKFASFTGGLIFMFSGVMISHRSHTQIIFTIVWLPLVLLFLEKFRKTKKFKFILISAIFYSISFFAGHPQIFLYGSLVIVAFIIFYTFIYEKPVNYYFLLAFTVFIIGFLIISIQLVPTYDLMTHSFRRSAGYDFFTSFSFEPGLLPILIFPFIYGSKLPISGVQEYFGPWNYGEMIIYFGISTIPFLVFGFFKKNKHKFLWIFILIFSFFLVLGKNTPLYKVMFSVPLFNKFRVPARNWFEFGLAFAVLAGFGFDYFIKSSEKKIKIISFAIIAFLASIYNSFFIFKLIILSKYREIFIKILEAFNFRIYNLEKFLLSIRLINHSIYIPLILITITICILTATLFKKNKFVYILLIVFIFLDLFSMGHFYEDNVSGSYVTKSLKDSKDLNFLSNEEGLFRIYTVVSSIEGYEIYPNQNIHYKIDNILGYDPFIIDDYYYITTVKDNPYLKQGWENLLRNNSILSMLNVKYIILSQSENFDNFVEEIEEKHYNNYSTVYDKKGIIILENKNYIQRFHFVSKVKNISDLEETREILWGEDNIDDYYSFEPENTALVKEIDFDRREFLTDDSVVSIVQYKNNVIVLETESSDDSFLIFSDTYYPGWKAYIDDVENKIYRTNGILKGIYIPKGSHKIVFNYLPSNFWFLLIISLTALFSVILSLIIICIRDKRRSSQP